MAGDYTDTQVIVVGAGPVGLLLAGELRLAGADVVVLEKLTAPTTASRASTLHARTMEILDTRGLLERLDDVPHDPVGHFGGIPLDLSLPTPYPGQWKVPQTRLEEVLGQWAADLGADIWRGHELTGLTATADGVVADVRTDDGTRLTVRGAYAVGCDGENSAVRRLGGFEFPGTDAGRELLRADVEGIDIPARRFERLEQGLVIAARRPDGVTRVMVHEFGSAPRAGAPSFQDVADTWKRITGEDIGSGTPLWVNSFGDASRQAAHYRRGRLLLAGDAAHQQMPIGGQALNLGLQDAFNLGWKLAALLDGHGGEELLDSYHEERHAVGQAVQSNVRTQALLLLGGPEVDAVREVFAELTGHEDVRTHLAAAVSGLDVRYEAGPGDGPVLGLRAPRCAAVTGDGTTTTFALLRSGQGLLLLPAGDEARREELRALAKPWTDRVRLATALPAEGPAGAAGADATAGTLLIRPDGHVVWSDGPGEAGLTAALERWFGPASPRTTRPAALPEPSSAPAHRPQERRTKAATSTTAATSTAGKRRNGTERLSGRTALVTGSSRGMGRAVAGRLAEEGALVAVHYATDEAAAHEVVACVERDGGRAFAIRAELGVDGDVEGLFADLEEGLLDRTGSTDLHILVNNAGVMGGTSAAEITPEHFDRIFAVNAKAPFFLIRRALRNMPDGGRIINISSGLTRFANPDEIAYAMSKGALEQLALHFAKSLGPRNITINSVAPGITRNGNPVFDIPEAVEQMAALSAFNRVGEPEDIADVVAFLATDEARWITGSFVDATGGTLLG
ncbi:MULTISPECIES: SDR family oxidoreductase [unclassified Streptomyces]|uniref:SDR family oxidoreductase n=1 Tax=unclassified Streptomyces TaxID=2593676 RepID=UPI002E30CDA4|nr:MULTISPECIES: SDR family oxidoreductase [unclassified Streptomyces]WUC69100.1 SDR family oxidoreductase [Streptomyces sp. NBC_00539]